MDSSQCTSSYCPDFSDICSEDSTFWDFLRIDEKTKINLSNKNSKDSFWDFLESSNPVNVSLTGYEEDMQLKVCKNPAVQKLLETNSNLKLLNKELEETANEYNKMGSLGSGTCSEDVPDESEDEFWDFLKSDNPTWKSAKSTNFAANSVDEFEEIKKLASLTTQLKDNSSIYSGTEFLKSSEQVLDSKKLIKNSDTMLNNTDMYRDLDEIISEINSTLQEMEKNVSKAPQVVTYDQKNVTSNVSENKTPVSNESSNTSAKFMVQYENYVNNLESNTERISINGEGIVNMKLPICDINDSEKKDIKLKSERETRNVQPSIPVQKERVNNDSSKELPITSTSEPAQRDYSTPVENSVGNDPHLLNATANSNVPFCDVHLQNKYSHNANSSLNGCKAKSFTQPESDQFNSSQSDLKSACKVQSSTNLPVISSIFSISTCPDIFIQNEVSTKEQIPSQKKTDISTKNISVDTSGHSSIAPLSSSLSVSNSLSKQNLSCSSNTNRTGVFVNSFPPAPKKYKNVKRLLPQSSPKNSIFRITDCDSGGNTQNYAEILTLNNAREQKRQKTNDFVSSLNIVYPNTSNLKTNLKYQSHVPVKSVGTLPNAFEDNSLTVSNPVSLYLVIPKNNESNQNTEFVMLFNNNTSANNVKNIPNLVNTIPVLPTTCTQSINTQNPGNTGTTHFNQQISAQKFPQITVPTVNLMTLKDNKQAVNIPSYMQQTLICEPLYQSVGNEGKNAKIIVNSSNINTVLPNASSQNYISTTAGSTNVMSHLSFTNPSCIRNNSQFPNIVTKLNGSSMAGKEDIVSNISNKFQQPNQIENALSCNSLPQKRTKNFKLEKPKPIKNIALGKDKNAIQQISFPLKMENVLGPNICGTYDNLGNNLQCDTSYSLTELTTNFIAMDSSKKGLISQENNFPIKQQNMSKNSKVIDFIPFKPKTDSILIKRDLISNTGEIINKNEFFKTQQSSQLPILKSINPLQNSELSSKAVYDETKRNFLNIDQIKRISQLDTETEKKAASCKEHHESQGVLKSFSDNSKFQSVTTSAGTDSKMDALATLQELFPPPISMIPVCVVQNTLTSTTPTVSKVLVLHDSNPTISIKQAQTSNSNASRKTYTKKTTMKIKKMGRKTVRELLQERCQKAVVDQQFKVYQPRAETKMVKPVSNLSGGHLLMPAMISNKSSRRTQDADFKVNVSLSSSKRPNIMILPSASKITQENSVKEIDRRQISQQDNPTEDVKPRDRSVIFELPKDFLSFGTPAGDRIAHSKEYRPKHYDMCELSIGYFKVEDDVDACGRFRSKFKVLFTKRQFLYDFPVVNCNQVDLNSAHVWDQMARILVPFKIIAAITMLNRRITIQVNSCPQIYLWKSLSKSGSISNAKGPSKVSLDNNMWIDAMHNSFIHKIILRKRQADSLKILLCQFEPKFLLLCNMNIDGNYTMDATPCEEELVAINLKKIQQKNKKNAIRRLPQWDSEYAYEPPVLMEEDPLFASNHVCSCRISCRSLRCSCVKAAKSCSTEGTICSCTNCDNPLNVLESFGLHLDFSLSDCCLFQNIYQIPKLRNYLEREIKLSCCNTIARILDCIPGTILCPNTECNASLEFSWCRGVICYPERNPRNHCSFCGQCCFSNGRHCPVCNRCYVVKPKSLNCPICGANGVFEKPMVKDAKLSDNISRESPTRGSISIKKPEIIVLDKSSNAKDNSVDNKEKTRVTEIALKNNFFQVGEKIDLMRNETDLVKIDICEEQTIGDEIPSKKTEDCMKTEENFLEQGEINHFMNHICGMEVEESKEEIKTDESLDISLNTKREIPDDFSTEKCSGISVVKFDVSPMKQGEIKEDSAILPSSKHLEPQITPQY